jgi:hypothetical protein
MAVSPPSIGVTQPDPSPTEHEELRAQEARSLEPGEELPNIFSIISSDNKTRSIHLRIYCEVPTSPR